MSTLYLINPASGRKDRSAMALELIPEAYRDTGEKVEVRLINFETLDRDLEEAMDRGVDRIFAVGGDGTVNAVGTRLVGTSVSLGIIPQGSGNGFARNIGFSINLGLAVKQSVNAEKLTVDTATVNGIPFLNVAGVGMDADAAWLFSQGSQRGFLAYARSGLRILGRYKPQSYKLTLDGEKRSFDDVMGIIIANGTQWGYNATISPNSSMTDGKLDILVLRKFPMVAVFPILGKLFSSRLHRSRFVESFTAGELGISRAHDGYAQIDGEPITAGPDLIIKVLPRSLNLLVPATLTSEKAESI